MKTGIKLLTIGYIAIIIALVAITDLGLGKPLYDLVKAVPGSDKTGHFLLMGFISFPIHLMMKKPLVKIFRIPIPKGVFIILSLVLLEELSQFFLSYRNCSPYDFACDVAGVFLFGYLAILCKTINFRKAKAC